MALKQKRIAAKTGHCMIYIIIIIKSLYVIDINWLSSGINNSRILYHVHVSAQLDTSLSQSFHV